MYEAILFAKRIWLPNSLLSLWLLFKNSSLCDTSDKLGKLSVSVPPFSVNPTHMLCISSQWWWCDEKKQEEEVHFLLMRIFILQFVISNIFSPLYVSCWSSRQLSSSLQNPDVYRMNQCPVWLTGTWPLMMTSSAKRTLTGLVFNLAFLAALMNADLGDFWRQKGERQKFKGQLVLSEMSHVFFQL